MVSRPITRAEIAAAVRTVTLAFAGDPIWASALRRSDETRPDLEPYWRLFLDRAAGLGTVRTIEDGAAIAVWIPPGDAELDEPGLAALEAWIATELDPAASESLHALFDRFDASRAGRPDHYYLSLLATHPDHRGRGVGQALLAADLEGWDAAGVPAYLESTNPANDHRYARAGFRPDGGFRAVRDDAWITAMWRPAGG